VVVARDVRDPGRFADLPDSTGQADATLERRGVARAGELVEGQPGHVPRADAMHQPARPVGFPDGATLPSQGAADRLDHAWSGLFESGAFRQRTRGFEQNLLLRLRQAAVDG